MNKNEGTSSLRVFEKIKPDILVNIVIKLYRIESMNQKYRNDVLTCFRKDET